MATTEFAVNNKVHIATKISLFMVNYKRELRKEADIRRKEKVEKVTEFAERMKNTRESRSSIKLSIKGNRITTR